ncbi:hypothetical protein ACRALDRAFT_2032887 [Sodiomyces alcalophilus JCM 7366]|uniref:uncharacterized protein n=1 Tax=Sodiomyces alcalophilus JCM 7366 TaxID=591952 RepID=UPI0039B4EDF3
MSALSAGTAPSTPHDRYQSVRFQAYGKREKGKKGVPMISLGETRMGWAWMGSSQALSSGWCRDEKQRGRARYAMKTGARLRPGEKMEGERAVVVEKRDWMPGRGRGCKT